MQRGLKALELLARALEGPRGGNVSVVWREVPTPWLRRGRSVCFWFRGREGDEADGVAGLAVRLGILVG